MKDSMIELSGKLSKSTVLPEFICWYNIKYYLCFRLSQWYVTSSSLAHRYNSLEEPTVSTFSTPKWWQQTHWYLPTKYLASYLGRQSSLHDSTLFFQIMGFKHGTQGLGYSPCPSHKLRTDHIHTTLHCITYSTFPQQC